MTFIKVTRNRASSNLQNFVQIPFERAISRAMLFDASEGKVFNVTCTENPKKEAHVRMICCIKDTAIFIVLQYLYL